MLLYNTNSENIFLDPSSVDLFITHPPYFNVNVVEYGNESGQIGKSDTPEEYANRLINIVKHMEHALRPEGNIFLMVPNDWLSPSIVGNIQSQTNLQIGQVWFWDFSVSHPNPGYAPHVLIYQLFKKGKSYLVKESQSCYLSVPWLSQTLVEKYSDLGYCVDAFPIEIAEYFIERYSNPGDVVGDLLGGTGTVAVASKKLNRGIVYNDISSSQYEVAKARIYLG